MKILMITNLYPPYYNGGYELACKNFSDGLEKRNNQVIILTSQYGVKKTSVDRNVYRLLKLNPTGGLSYRPIRFNPFRIRIRFKQLLWSLFSRQNYEITKKVIKKFNPDIICAWNMEEIGVMPLMASKTMRVPTVIYVQDYWLSFLKETLLLDTNKVKKQLHLFLEGLYDFNQLDLSHLIMVSRGLKQHYVEMGFPEKNIYIIENGIPENLIIDKDKLFLRKNNERTICLLFVGRLVQEKGTHIAIQALNILINQYNINNICLDIIGDGTLKYKFSIKKVIAELDLENHVHFIGRMDHKKVIEEYGNHFAVLIPSLWDEPFGLTVLEAMARGIPVIASDRGNFPDMIDNGRSGFIVPAEKPEAYAMAVINLINDRDLYQKIQINALQDIQNRYRFDLVLDKIIAFFSSILVI